MNKTLLYLHILIYTLSSCGVDQPRTSGEKRHISTPSPHQSDIGQENIIPTGDSSISQEDLYKTITERDKSALSRYIPHIQTLHPSHCTDLYIECIKHKFDEGIRELLQSNIPYHHPSTEGIYPIYYAIEQDNYTATELLIDYGALLKEYPENNVSILLYSYMHQGQSDIYQLLISRGAYYHPSEYDEVLRSYGYYYDYSPTSEEYINILISGYRIIPDLTPEGIMEGKEYDINDKSSIGGINIVNIRPNCTCPVCHKSIFSSVLENLCFYKCYYDVVGNDYDCKRYFID